jgi:hypothetical protein
MDLTLGAEMLSVAAENGRRPTGTASCRRRASKREEGTMADRTKQVDVSSMSTEEIALLQNEVLRTLAARVRAGGTIQPDYDRHMSGHSRNQTDVETAE